MSVKLVSEFSKEIPLSKLLAESNSDLNARLPSTLPKKPLPQPKMIACSLPLFDRVWSRSGCPRTSDSPAPAPKC